MLTILADEPYRRPTSKNTFPFTPLQYTRLLALRGKLELDQPALRVVRPSDTTYQPGLL